MAALPPTPTNATAGSAPSGACWYTIIYGDSCGKVETTFYLTQAELFVLNPQLAPSSTNLVLNDMYCARTMPGSAPPPTGPSTNSNPGIWGKYALSLASPFILC
ncbi:hypothetical protein C8R44DRAFT_895267 [Mycena epipterygia]|nr:hypothetical protein C8R44DRAFT_895267 [Mycena epipterygia]